jgi:hypothetical protein
MSRQPDSHCIDCHLCHRCRPTELTDGNVHAAGHFVTKNASTGTACALAFAVEYKDCITFLNCSSNAQHCSAMTLPELLAKHAVTALKVGAAHDQYCAMVLVTTEP